MPCPSHVPHLLFQHSLPDPCSNAGSPVEPLMMLLHPSFLPRTSQNFGKIQEEQTQLVPCLCKNCSSWLFQMQPGQPQLSYLMVTLSSQTPEPFPQTFPAITGRAWAVLGSQLAPAWLRGKSPEPEMSPEAQVMCCAALPTASLSSLLWVAQGALHPPLPGSVTVCVSHCLTLQGLTQTV